MTLDKNWRSALSDCLAAVEREQTSSACPVVDHEIVAEAAAGESTVWLICRNDAERRQFADTELGRFTAALRRRMLAAGFAEGEVDALRARVTSRDEVQRRGGYSFFR